MDFPNFFRTDFSSGTALSMLRFIFFDFPYSVRIDEEYWRALSSLPQYSPLTANPIKWSNTLKQFVGNLPTNCLSVFDHFVGLALKEIV